MMTGNRAELENYLRQNIDFSLLDQDQIYSFLNQDQTDKDNRYRVFAWLIQLHLISNEKEKMIENILDMYQNYLENIGSQFNESSNPFQNTQDEETSLIYLDVRRISDWFLNMAKPLNFDQCYLDDFQFHIRRILYFLPKIDPQSDFHYIQGFDRYASITYLLGLDFIRKVSNNNLLPFSLEFAEMLSLHFTHDFISLSRLLINITNSPKEIMDVFENIDKIIEKEIPSISKNLKKCSTSSVHFALRWTLLLFADEHDFNNCLVLWDHFVLHQKDFPTYMVNVSISHLKQVPYDGISYIDKIQNFKNWDVPQIIKEAENYSDEYIFLKYCIGATVTAFAIYFGVKVFKKKPTPKPTFFDIVKNKLI